MPTHSSRSEPPEAPLRAWEAIATGRGRDSWFMGRNEIEPREGGRVRWSIGGCTAAETVWGAWLANVFGGAEAVSG